MAKNKFFILDAYALIFRSYYAFINNPRYNSKGLNTSAIYGFTNVLEEILKKENPSHIAVCFDAPAKTFRKDIYPEYKANRQATPEDIKKSIPYIKDILKAYNIPILEEAGFEADDLAGALAKKFSTPEFEVFLMTSDKDYLQLIDENIKVYKPKTKKHDVRIIDLEKFQEIYGLKSPEQYIEVLALAGDTADNVPGIPGVGEKTALKLLIKYGSIKEIYKHVDELSPKQKEKFIENKDLLELSHKLVTIKLDIDIKTSEEDIKIKKINEQELITIFNELEFKTTAKRVVEKNRQTSLFGDIGGKQMPEQKLYKTIKDINPDYRLIETEYELEELIKKLESVKEFAFDTETTSLNTQLAEIVGISFSMEKNRAFYLSFSQDKEATRKTLEKFQKAFANENILKIGQNLKYDLSILKNYNIDVNGKLFDTMIAHHLLAPELKNNMDYLAETYLNYKTIKIEQLIGKKGSTQKNMQNIAPEKVKDYAAEDADITLQLKEYFYPKLEKEKLLDIFEKIEMPLVYVLSQMEHFGVILDVEFLKNYRKEIIERVTTIEKEIYEIAGSQFNISSPKQLGDILFKKLKISEKPKLTKTKQYATGEPELMKYKGKHPIVELIFDFRSLKKLITTYIDALPKLVNPKTNKLHASFNQAITVTGRLSSNNPNLQNIPIRTKEGREIRKAFIPEKGNIFIDAEQLLCYLS